MRQKYQRQLLQIGLLAFVLCQVRYLGTIRIKQFIPSFPFILPKSFMKRFAQQQATWTRGPSLPSHIPDATARHCIIQVSWSYRLRQVQRTSPRDLITNVQVPMNLRITKPPRMVLISGIPLCFAYNAYSFTNKLAVTPNSTWDCQLDALESKGTV